MSANAIHLTGKSEAPVKLTPPQYRVLNSFRIARVRKSHPDYWLPADAKPVRALLRYGFIRYDLGPYRDDSYALTEAGLQALNAPTA